MVALAFLMPIVASMGGNAGMQTLAITIRTLATNDLTRNNLSQNVMKEFSIGVLNGVIFAIISAFIVQLWFNDIQLSLIISISMVLEYDSCRLIWNSSSHNSQKNEYRPRYCFKCFCNNNNRCYWFLSFLGVGAYFFYGN